MYSQFSEATLGWRRKNFSFDRPQAEIEMDLNGQLGNDVNQVFEHFEINGRHCKSGLAFQNGTNAVCTDAVKVMQDGK